MMTLGDKITRRMTAWAGATTCVFVALMWAGTTVASAQWHSPDLTRLEVTGFSTDIPDFGRVWTKDRAAYPGGESSFECGGLIGANDFPLSQCEVPVADLLALAHPRLLAWVDFAGPSDEYLSPRYDCVVNSLPNLLGDVYQQMWTRNSDKMMIHYEQGNRYREIWMDGRKHPPMTEQFYMGHSVGWFEGDEFIVDTQNFTFDIDGFDDHSHLPTSHLKHLIEHYRKTGEDTMELTITVFDPLFMLSPLMYKHYFHTPEADAQYLRVWECDPETSRRELSVMAPDKYEGQ
jgi:hypothetical protein